MGIGLKTLTDKSTRNLAEMLTQGSGMGGGGLRKKLQGLPQRRPGRKAPAQRLQDFEEDNRIQLERFCEYVPPHKKHKVRAARRL